MKTREARKVICMELKNAIAIDGFELHNWYLNLDQFSLYNLVFMYVLHAKRLSRSTKSQHGSKINFTEEQDAKVGAWPAVHHSHDATNSNGDHHPLRILQTPLRRGQAWLHLWHKPLLITFVVIQTVFFCPLPFVNTCYLRRRWLHLFYNFYGEYCMYIYLQ